MSSINNNTKSNNNSQHHNRLFSPINGSSRLYANSPKTDQPVEIDDDTDPQSRITL